MTQTQKFQPQNQQQQQPNVFYGLLDKLRTQLEQGKGQEIKINDVIECAGNDCLGTYEQLLAFEQYEMFQEVRKKKPITDAQLIDCQSTRELYRGYIQSKKGMKDKKKEIKQEEFSLKRLQEDQRQEKKRKMIKYMILSVAVLISCGILIKYRHLLVKLIKVILNIK